MFVRFKFQELNFRWSFVRLGEAEETRGCSLERMVALNWRPLYGAFQEMGPNIQKVLKSVAEWLNCSAIQTSCCHFISLLNPWIVILMSTKISQSSLDLANSINHLLTEREGRNEVVTLRTERSEVRTKTIEGQYSPVRLEQARWVSCLWYGTLFLIVNAFPVACT